MKLLLLTPILGLSALTPLTFDGQGKACKTAEVACQTAEVACKQAQSACEAQRPDESSVVRGDLAEARRELAELREAVAPGALRRVPAAIGSQAVTAGSSSASGSCEASCRSGSVAGSVARAAGANARSGEHLSFECDGEELAACLRELGAGERGVVYALSQAAEGRGGSVARGNARSYSVGSSVGGGAAGGGGGGTLGERIKSKLQRVFADGQGADVPSHFVLARQGGDGQHGEHRKVITIRRSSDGQEPQVLHLEHGDQGGVLRLGQGSQVRVLKLSGDDDIEVHELDGEHGTIEIVVRSADGERQVLRLDGRGDAVITGPGIEVKQKAKDKEKIKSKEKSKEKAKDERKIVLGGGGPHVIGGGGPHVIGGGGPHVIVGRGDGKGIVWKDGAGETIDLEDLDFELLDDLDDLDDLDELHELGGDLHLELHGEGGLGKELHGMLKGLKLHGDIAEQLHGELEGLKLHGAGGVRVIRPDSARLLGLPRGTGDDERVHVLGSGGAGSGLHLRSSARDQLGRETGREVQELLDEMRLQVEELNLEIRNLRRQLRELDSGGAR